MQIIQKNVLPVQNLCPKDVEDVVHYYETADNHVEKSNNGLSRHVKAVIEDIFKDVHKSLLPLTQFLISRGISLRLTGEILHVVMPISLKKLCKRVYALAIFKNLQGDVLDHVPLGRARGPGRPEKALALDSTCYREPGRAGSG